jgi:hypothetical protein
MPGAGSCDLIFDEHVHIILVFFVCLVYYCFSYFNVFWNYLIPDFTPKCSYTYSPKVPFYY